MPDKRSYYELLRDPQWQRKRLEIMKRAAFRCEMCEDDKATLNVHHSYYEKGLMPWEYADESLHCLCESCHKKAEVVRKSLQRQLGRISLLDIETLLGFARGLEMCEFPNTIHVVDNSRVATGILCAFAAVSNDFETRLDHWFTVIGEMPSEVNGYDVDFVAAFGSRTGAIA